MNNSTLVRLSETAHPELKSKDEALIVRHAHYERLRKTVSYRSRIKFTALIALSLSILTLPAPATEKNASTGDNLIQIAILLDASNSMDGLIDQAKSQLWKIVNELALAKRDGVAPRLEVAFYEYGKSSLPQREGYLRRIVPLTTDLDRISDELFKLTTNGGDEYCGMVVSRALSDLAWNPGPRVMKAVYIAGNEPFTQGEVDYVAACTRSIAAGIVVNTIFCGPRQEGIASKWKHGADLADGSYIAIDQNLKVAAIAAPQDSAIMVLGQRLNATYIGYGNAGAARKSMQREQDAMALSAAPAVMVERSLAKSSVHYDNAGWDLVDAKKEKKVDLARLEAHALPEEMKKMNEKEREAYIDAKARERALLQAEIGKLDRERRNYLANQAQQTPGNATLDQAIVSSARKLALQKGYRFDTK